MRYSEPGEVLGHGVLGSVERADGILNVVRGQPEDQETVVIAHELGHHALHLDPHTEVQTVEVLLGGDRMDVGAGVVEGYSPRERKEVQADIYAGEFLCPGDWLRAEVVDRGRRPSEIAVDLGLPVALVLNQAIRGLLLPPLREPPLASPRTVLALDESQHAAATWAGGPLMVNAGPGTGKTRTLIERIGHVLDQGAAPASILALTFSNKAADELRARLGESHRDPAIEMWVGTFHAFGLELVTKWPGRVGRSAEFRVLDQSGQLALLESRLTELPLRHYQNLFEPALLLTDVLQAISRCKDELITPEVYLGEARAALAAAGADERETAEKSVEIGEIYAVYERALVEADAVDFGDLIGLSVRLLSEHDDIREAHQARFKHILVDEYQDVNMASARLLRLLAGSCDQVWVVGDQRQSIYRFRGAEPANVQRFSQDFGGSKLSLNRNYRSGAPVVRAFSGFSRQMAADPDAGFTWDAHRGEVGAVTLTIAGTVAEEAAAIRDQIEALRAEGIPYGDQVILARSHLTLSRITEVLERLGTPLLYLGDLFERSEVRDLLSLVAIDAEYGGIGLVRVAHLPQYGTPKADALRLLAWATEFEVPVMDALSRLDEIDGLSVAGQAGLAALAHDLRGLGPASSPWTVLTTWLFERSDYLRPLFEAGDARAQQSLIAIYQLLKVCGEPLSVDGGEAFRDPGRSAFLERIRRIEALRQDTRYRAVSAEASDFDAVRVMTIHGSKGLEFGGVHLPAIATRYMPTSRQGNRCPPPATLAHLAMQKDDHDAEEECLFFVGLSRARDRLCLSRAERYTRTNASASKFLDSVTPHLAVTRFTGPAPLGPPAPNWTPRPVQDIYDERDLDTFLRCPARYQYEVVDGLRGGRDSSAFLRFHRCVHRTMGWLEQARREGRPASTGEAGAELARQWVEHGPVGHGFEAYYRAAADTMVRSIARLVSAETADYDREPWLITVGDRVIRYAPDRVVLDPAGGVRIQRIRTGRQAKSEPDNRVYALIRHGAAQRYPDRAIRVEAYYPATDEAIAFGPKADEKSLGDYREAIAAIERGEAPATPADARHCPNCPCYFICGV